MVEVFANSSALGFALYLCCHLMPGLYLLAAPPSGEVVSGPLLSSLFGRRVSCDILDMYRAETKYSFERLVVKHYFPQTGMFIY